MGQKVNPTLYRLGILHGWRSRWFGKRLFRQQLREDYQVREFVMKRLVEAHVANVDIERSGKQIVVKIHTSRPGVVIGRGGEGVETLKRDLRKVIQLNPKTDLKVDIVEIRNPNANAQIIADSVREQLEKRMPFRRAINQTVENVMEAEGVQGAKIMVSGRLDGSEMSRREMVVRGSLPLHTIRADIDFARATAMTIFGTVGVKVWVYKGEVFDADTSI